MSKIHSTAVIEDGAVVEDEVAVGPYSVIGPNVRLGAGTVVHAHVSISGHTSLGAGCAIHPFASLGAPPQDIKYAGEPTRLEIGARTIIREHVSIHRGTPHGGAVTRIGSDCFFMVATHIAHDCQIGNGVIFVNQATVAGHVEVGDNAIVGALSAVHQRTRIGKYCFIGGMSGIPTDIIPFAVAKGGRGETSLHGLNLIGLRRRGYTREQIFELREAYRRIFSGPTWELPERVASVERDMAGSVPVMEIVAFIRERPDRHLCWPRRHDDGTTGDDDE